MALSHSGQPGQINVTPLIDVLLVLIIIFMVITPLSPQGLKTALPQKSNDSSPASPSTLVLSIASDLSLTLNQQPILHRDLPERFRAIAVSRAEPALFIKGSGELEFRTVAEVIDAAHGAGLDRIALMP